MSHKESPSGSFDPDSVVDEADVIWERVQEGALNQLTPHRDPEDTAHQALAQHVGQTLALLDPDEDMVFRLRFGILLKKPFEEDLIASRLGLTLERIRELEKSAIDKIVRQRQILVEELLGKPPILPDTSADDFEF